MITNNDVTRHLFLFFGLCYSDIEFTKSKDQDLEENLQKPQPSNEDTELVEMVCDWMDLEKIHKYDSMTGELIAKIDRFEQLFKKYNEKE